MAAILQPSISVFFFFFFLFLSASSLPFAVFHGLNGSCEHTDAYTDLLQTASGAKGYCIEIGNGASDSWFKTMLNQVEIACDKIKKMEEFKNGYNLIGVSQGNMVSRGVIHLCDDAPPVKNYISLSGPQAGVADLPDCRGGRACEIAKEWLKLSGKVVYHPCIQSILGPSNYVKVPTEIETYLKASPFLPKISNEIVRNSTYKQRFASLENLVLVMNEEDSVIVPKESSLFGFYEDGSTDKILLPKETLLYKEDWIGLRSLDETGKVKFVTSPGDHCVYTKEFMLENVVPYLKDNQHHKNEDDHVFTPKETSWFGYFPSGSTDIVLPANETLRYKKDWIGLRCLDEAGKVKYVSSPGEHSIYTQEFIIEYVVPYLKDTQAQQQQQVVAVA